jgi:hypothetical protein
MIDHKELLRLREQASFLGYEFLTWLFLLIDHEDGSTDFANITKDLIRKPESLTLGSRMTTCLLAHKEQKTSVSSPILEESHEAFASLKNGHVVESLALNLNFGEIIVSLMLHAHDFSLTQVKIKNNFDSEFLSGEEHSLNEDDKNREEIFLRMAAVDDVEIVVDTLYKCFLKHKTRNYSEVIEKMKTQVEGRLSHYLRSNRNFSVASSQINT